MSSSLKKVVSRTKKDRPNKKQRSDEWEDCTTPERPDQAHRESSSSDSDSSTRASPARQHSFSFSSSTRPILESFLSGTGPSSPSATSSLSARRSSFIFNRRPSVTSLDIKVNPTTKPGKFYVQIDSFKPKLKKYSKKITVLLKLQVGSETIETKQYESSQTIDIKESFTFPTTGDFNFRLEAFKIKDGIRESIGVHDIVIGTVHYPLKKVSYYLVSSKNQQTENEVSLQVACRLDEQDEMSNDYEPNCKGDLSMLSTDRKRWDLYQCQLRGRKLHFLTGKKKEKTLVIDKLSPVRKPSSADSEEIWPHYCIQIKCEDNFVFLTANNGEEMEMWMRKLNEAASSAF